MGDQLARAEYFVNQAEKKLNSWGLFGSKYEDASDLYEKAANSFKLAKSWDRAAATYVKLANCHLKLDSQHEAAQAYIEAAHCYKKTSVNEAISCLEQAVTLYCDIGRLSMAARYYKEMGELYETDQNIEKTIEYYEKAAEFFEGEEDIAASMDEDDVAKFTDVLKEFDSMTPLDSWKTTLLLRVKEKLKARELEEDDLT